MNSSTLIAFYSFQFDNRIGVSTRSDPKSLVLNESAGPVKINTPIKTTRITPASFINPTFVILMAIFTFIFLISCLIFPISSALQNITIGSKDSLITYFPSPIWWSHVNDANAMSGGYMLWRSPHTTTNASITRSFRSVQYAAPLWPFPVQVQITIDGEASQIVDLQDTSQSDQPSVPPFLGPSTEPSQVRWSFTSDSEELRTVVISSAETGTLGWVVVVDSLIFEVSDVDDVTDVLAASSP
ncbi:hypothetical protein CVT24_006822 [Panaeolus cyanescens]|uniref:Uncharacterized protein n=1 Tax=Panaeolus cyanescens TaxID=181874 RepID=A0A409WC26_9AGAR|nr:hypothetical protein CVT24_006822 [Panaeolus cyanescens]